MSLNRDGDEITVLLDGESVTYLVPLEIVRMSGGSRLDRATFLYDLSQTSERIENLKTPVEFDKTVVVQVNGSTVFRGKLHRQDLTVSRTEQVIVTASVLPQQFGPPVRGMKVYDKRSDTYITTPGDVFFNPLIDGVIEGNMSSLSDDPEDMQVWCDPECVRTTEAETYRGESASEWVHTEALHSFARLLMNADIKPPETRGDPAIDDDAIPLQNVRIPFGATVPQGLDLLTHPFGYDWYLSHDGTESRVRVYRRGAGSEKTVTMQAIGETLDISDASGATNNHAFRLSMDIGARVNKLRLVGSREQWEIGFELYRGWPTADDTLSIADLDKRDLTSDYYDGKQDVWRLFVANEAGDYSGTRDSGAQTIPAAPRDWSDYGVLFDKRRPAEDLLTKGPDGRRLPPQLHWSDDDGSTWKPVPDEWRWSLLESQLGIRFLDDTPPAELMAAGDNALLRLCCTITGDECLEAKVAISGMNAGIDDEPGTVWQVIDVSDRYHFRDTEILGDYKSFIWESGDESADRDDTESIQKAADYLLQEIDGADIAGDLRLIGIRTNYEIGDLITEVAGRSIDLNRRTAEAGVPRYLQVSGVRWLFGETQETQLLTRPQQVDPWYQPGARPDGEV